MNECMNDEIYTCLFVTSYVYSFIYIYLFILYDVNMDTYRCIRTLHTKNAQQEWSPTWEEASGSEGGPAHQQGLQQGHISG